MTIAFKNANNIYQGRPIKLMTLCLSTTSISIVVNNSSCPLINTYKDSSHYYSGFRNVQSDLNYFMETWVEYWGSDPTHHNLTDYAVYPLSIDGYYGNCSEVAVYLFQQKMGLSADGVVGPLTKRTLYNWCMTH